MRRPRPAVTGGGSHQAESSQSAKYGGSEADSHTRRRLVLPAHAIAFQHRFSHPSCFGDEDHAPHWSRPSRARSRNLRVLDRMTPILDGPSTRLCASPWTRSAMSPSIFVLDRASAPALPAPGPRPGPPEWQGADAPAPTGGTDSGQVEDQSMLPNAEAAASGVGRGGETAGCGPQFADSRRARRRPTTCSQRLRPVEYPP